RCDWFLAVSEFIASSGSHSEQQARQPPQCGVDLACRDAPLPTFRHVPTSRQADMADAIRNRADHTSSTLARIVHQTRSTVLAIMDRAADACAVAGTPVVRRPRQRADANAQACIPGTRATPSTIALVTILAAQTMVVLDFSIVNVALPSIQQDLAF